ncbi:uncharacterized protein CLAFUR5_04604 [Fulvia fulva]|uniref:Uncharacterized protein n=1 Tax=Passalora fulva TaxID=5499 RepID=A0A9Q8LFA1_PASFU|nr:uncharacterized protein CLAFUR5_04604 [Fulvia fulva]KAK4627916.1 hypothetical protein CLAFUR0_04632 [Fulvia fulva]UJO16415.1 hypothetical protein CLAFUR5_04604 [Fulvia fulva]WPV29227.1 hypothetical protein CLAFUW7_04636 [Fulvia fulva]
MSDTRSAMKETDDVATTMKWLKLADSATDGTIVESVESSEESRGRTEQGGHMAFRRSPAPSPSPQREHQETKPKRRSRVTFEI